MFSPRKKKNKTLADSAVLQAAEPKLIGAHLNNQYDNLIFQTQTGLIQ